MSKIDFQGFEDRINLIPAINRGYAPDFHIGKNFLGSSAAPFGTRRNVINNREDLRLDFKNQTLAGNFFHRGVDSKKVLYEMTKDINKTLGFKEIEYHGRRFIELDNGNFIEFEVLSEKDWAKKYPHLEYIKFYDGWYYRQHPDIYSTLYILENKSTQKPKGMWGELAAYQIQQLNSYLGFLHKAYGFLFKVDLGSMKEDPHGGFFNSASKRFSFIWNKYFLFHPHNFDKVLFEYSIGRIKDFFMCMRGDIDIDKIPCPEFLFSCDNKCREYCNNPIDKVVADHNEVCAHCKKEIRAGSNYLIRNNQAYHHTDGNKNRMEDCITACKDAYEVVSN